MSNFFDHVPEGEMNEEMQELSALLQQSDTMLQHFSFEAGEYRLVVKMINTSTNPDPAYAKEGDSGFDLRANLKEPITLKPLQRALIPTGLFFAVPLGWEMQIRPRSGLAIKHGISVVNTPGTVDSGYRGEVKVILINLSDEEFVVNHGERICQAVVAPVVHNVKLTPVETLDETERGATGFGSSGVQ